MDKNSQRPETFWWDYGSDNPYGELRSAENPFYQDPRPFARIDPAMPNKSQEVALSSFSETNFKAISPLHGDVLMHETDSADYVDDPALDTSKPNSADKPIHPVTFPDDDFDDIRIRSETDHRAATTMDVTTLRENASLGNAAAHVMESMATTRGKAAFNRKDALLKDIFFLIDKGVVWSGVDPHTMDEASLRAAITHLKQNVDVLPKDDSLGALAEIHARVSHHLDREPIFFPATGQITPEAIADRDRSRRAILAPEQHIHRVKSSKYEGVEYTSDTPGVITIVDPATGEVYMDVTGAIQLGYLSSPKFVGNKQARAEFEDIRLQYAGYPSAGKRAPKEPSRLGLKIKNFMASGHYGPLELPASKTQKAVVKSPRTPWLLPKLKTAAAAAGLSAMVVLGHGATTQANAPEIAPALLKANPPIEQPKGAEAIVEGIMKKHRTPRKNFVLKNEQARQMPIEKKADTPKPRINRPSGPGMIA